MSSLSDLTVRLVRVHAGFDETQTAVPIIRQICMDVYPYLFVLTTILVGCAFVFMNLLHIDDLDLQIAHRYTSPVSCCFCCVCRFRRSFCRPYFLSFDLSAAGHRYDCCLALPCLPLPAFIFLRATGSI
jgi:hypothetical protein